MFKKYRKWIIGFLAATICLSGCGLFWVYWTTNKFFEALYDIPPTLVESKSPSNLGTADFLRESTLRDGSIYFYVRDPARSSHPLPVNKSREYGFASDGDVTMTQAVWSADGSIIAVRAKIGDGADKNYGTFFVDAYDFQKHHAVGNELPVRKKSQVIKDLMRNRGGEGKIAVNEPYAEGDIISESQANEFKK
jgi:hypothetical protein